MNDVKETLRKAWRSKTIRTNVGVLAAAAVAYLYANPQIVAPYGPAALAAVAVANIYLRYKTNNAIADK